MQSSQHCTILTGVTRLTWVTEMTRSFGWLDWHGSLRLQLDHIDHIDQMLNRRAGPGWWWQQLTSFWQVSNWAAIRFSQNAETSVSQGELMGVAPLKGDLVLLTVACDQPEYAARSQNVCSFYQVLLMPCPGIQHLCLFHWKYRKVPETFTSSLFYSPSLSSPL